MGDRGGRTSSETQRKPSGGSCAGQRNAHRAPQRPPRLRVRARTAPRPVMSRRGGRASIETHSSSQRLPRFHIRVRRVRMPVSASGVLALTTAGPMRRRREQQLAHVYETRKQVRRAEAWHILGLALLAVLACVISYFAFRGLFERVPHKGFQASDTAQVITAVGALATAIGTGIAAILKAYALLIQARADMIRAKTSLPPADESRVTAEPDAGGE